MNQVGVNLNTASPSPARPRLGHRPGAGARASSSTAQKQGVFQVARDLLDVPRFSEKVFEQAAGLPAHPRARRTRSTTPASTPSATRVLEKLAARLGKQRRRPARRGRRAGQAATREFRAEVGAFTFDDIVKELEKPGPRSARVVRAVLASATTSTS